jgi:uncharacterized protein
MQTITLEEHFATPEFLEGPGRDLKERALQFGGPAAKLLEQLCDVGEKRMAEMDAAGIGMQVLSLTSPGTEQLTSLRRRLLLGTLMIFWLTRRSRIRLVSPG